ncbi:MAG: TetR/AcrR family transcriptional regulator [Bacteroidia bacterium]
MTESQKILKGADKLFMRVGIKSVSMNDLARELGISKKTIYKHFKDKEDLIDNVIDADVKSDINACLACTKIEGNSIRKMIEISKHISSSHQDLNPAVIYDLKKYYPAQWQKMVDLQEKFIQESIKANLEQGIMDGLYRTDVNSGIISSIYRHLVQAVMTILAHPDNTDSFQTLHRQMIKYHLYGVCTQKGLQYLEKHINEI